MKNNKMSKKRKFAVMKHEAKRAGLHYDLRFEKPDSNIWKSFACRKEIPLNPGKKILAVMTHDHTEKEAMMLGTIEDGYGAGILSLWDSGTCEILKFHNAHFTLKFNGKKLNGIYHLVSVGNFRRRYYKKQQYLLFKSKMD
jgi:DNA ligase D-like protein (predicted 3'-phosphoesterase)